MTDTSIKKLTPTAIGVTDFLGICIGTGSMFLSVPITMSIKIILENNPRTHWIAVMLGSKSDALVILEE